MYPKTFSNARLAYVGVILSIGAASCHSVSKTDDGAPIRIESLTIFPVTAIGTQHERFGEVLGLIMEKEGFRGAAMADATFRPSESSPDFDATTTAFGKFVAENPVATEHALYAEFDGDPLSGVAAVRGVIVSRDGKVVWSDVQTASDAAFRRVQPAEPMTCCALLVERVGPLLVTAPPESREEDGELTLAFAKRSGIPTRSERKEMDARLERLRGERDTTKIVVYPIRTGETVDRELGQTLVESLTEATPGLYELASSAPWFEVDPSPNEQKVLWQMARAFRDARREAAPAESYALYADALRTPTGSILAVHFVVCDPNGEFVLVDYQNSHHEDFQTIAPQTIADVPRLIVRRLTAYLADES